MFTLMPYLTRFEASVSKWLIPAEDRRRFFLRFNFEGLLRADSKGRAEMYASALQNGWINRNEVRGKENFKRVDGLDGYTAQTNLASVEKIVEGALEKALARFDNPPREPAPIVIQSAPVPAENHNGTSLNVKLPESLAKEMEYTVEHPGIDHVVALTKDTEKRLNTRMARIEGAATDLIAAIRAVIGGQERLAEQIESGNERLVERVEAGDARVAESIISAARMRRKVTVGSETFVSEPADEA
jgi:hypothetical protein